MIVDKIEDIAAAQANAISNIAFDKVVVYDSGKGNAVGNFLGGLTQALPPFHEVAKMAGVELPEYLGRMGPGAGERAARCGNAAGGRCGDGRGRGVGRAFKRTLCTSMSAGPTPHRKSEDAFSTPPQGGSDIRSEAPGLPVCGVGMEGGTRA